ncbi:MAG: hypothetical protein HYW24_03410 [Candidatus Aenigmarchaeota archaeon]|nr:hypothetical protein [Candidatus Aenigmarchaeota archaeon]
MKQETKRTNVLRTYVKRFEFITLSRFRDYNKIKRASEAMDKIREKTKGKDKESMTETIRKWRDARYVPSRS